jgi:molecular chaperone DnaJ
MSLRDYYEVLGVERTASVEVIKRAYRKLALDNHPDRNPNDTAAEERFKAATEAYDVLANPEKRALYDQFGHAGLRAGRGFGGPMDFDLADALRTFMRDFGGGGLGGFDFFGGGDRREDRRGSDLQLRLEMDLNEVATGIKKQIKLRKQVVCDDCGGSGARKGSKPATCTMCGGRGEVRQVSRSFFGQFINVSVCPECQGSGDVVRDPCPSCRGEGRIKGEATVSVTVPAGVAAGNYIQMRGLGDAGRRGGAAGDIIVFIDEKEHAIFERKGIDLLMDLPISYTSATLGGQSEVPTLDGNVMVDIPRGIQSGKVLRLKGRGLPSLRDRRRGDILVRVQVWIPDKPGSEEKTLLEGLRKIETQPPAPGDQRPGRFERTRDARED